MKLYSAKLNVDDEHHLVFAVLLTMREIHRPIHPAFIYAKDWILMSDEEKSTATREGKIRLPTKNEFRSMKKEDYKEWRAQVQPFIEEIHDSFLHVFKNFPKSLLLVSRFVRQISSSN